MTDDIALTDTQIKLLDLMFYYRCATPIQLASFAYGPYAVTNSNEKYIYGQLAKMEDEGLVTRYKPHKKISRYAVFYLSKRGFDYKLTQLSLPETYIGSGWIGTNDQIDYGHFDYSVYKPPLKQLQHHLLMIDTLLVLYPMRNITYRNNLYAKRIIGNEANKQLLRADAEFKVDGEAFTIEVDCGTESHDQLVAKFENYFRYEAGYYGQHKCYDVQHIVFVVDAPNDGHLKRRWTNILAAYYKAMRKLADKFELHLVTLDNLEKFLMAYTSNKYDVAFKAAVLNRFKVRLVGDAEENQMHWQVHGIGATDESKKYALNYQIVATPYSTFNLRIREDAYKVTTPMHYYVIDTPYFADLSSYLVDTDKDYIRDVLMRYEQLKQPYERFYELK